MLRSQQEGFDMNIRISVQNENNSFSHTIDHLNEIQKTKMSDSKSTQDQTFHN